MEKFALKRIFLKYYFNNIVLGWKLPNLLIVAVIKKTDYNLNFSRKNHLEFFQI